MLFVVGTTTEVPVSIFTVLAYDIDRWQWNKSPKYRESYTLYIKWFHAFAAVSIAQLLHKYSYVYYHIFIKNYILYKVAKNKLNVV